MRRLFVLCILLMMTVPLHAQNTIYSRELLPFDITGVSIIRSNSEPLTLKIEATASTCGQIIRSEWHSEIYTDYIGERPVGDTWSGASPYRNRQYINLSLFTLPSEDDGCDLRHVIEIELPEFIQMPGVPVNQHEWQREPNAIVLVNDFAAWFYLSDDVAGAQSQGQPIDFGETELIRWQKVDSVIEDLEVLGAEPGVYLPWLEGYHPDGCEAVTQVNITRNPIEHDTYMVNVFRLLPVDSLCPATIQPFVVTAVGVVPQMDVLLNLGGTSYQVDSLLGTTMSVQRRYPTTVTTQLESTDEGDQVRLTATLPENCNMPLTIAQAQISGVLFLNGYYDVPTGLTCSNEEAVVEELLSVDHLPIVVNGTILWETFEKSDE